MSYRIIDAHYHPCSSYKCACVENVRQAFEIMDGNGLDAMCVQSVVLWYPWMLQLNPMLLLMKLLRPGRIYAFGGVRFPAPDAPDKTYNYAEQAQRLMGLGFDGIKLFAKPTIRRKFAEPINSPVFDELYDYLNRERIPLLFHIADPATFWDIERIPEAFRLRGWYYGAGGYPSQRKMFDETEDVLDRFPQLNIVLPHFYFHSDNLPRLAELLDRHPNLRIDCTPGVEMYYNFSENVDAARAFFIRYSNRIQFGTDNFGRALGVELDYASAARETIRYVRGMLEGERTDIFGVPQNGLHLPEEVLRRVYAENFLDYAGVAPRPVSVDNVILAAREALERAEACGAQTAAREIRSVLVEANQIAEGT